MKSRYYRKILVLYFCLLIRGANPVFADVPSPLLIIQQIRGSEKCCEPGTPDIFELSQEEDVWNLPLAWALRYDVFADEELIQKFQNLPKTHQLGLLLEVTPQLASASGVEYTGDPNGSDWNSGRNAFLIGYSQTERRRLIDTLFTEFFEQFSYYPALTVAWMIDSWSLEYLKSQYGVKIHELTKEQYETDSYTLYGGIFNLPYFPSLSHPLSPPKSEADLLDLLIVRQTVSDIEKNYGSYQSFYTTQPNDYLQNTQKVDFTYFTSLLDSVAYQTDSERFAVLGLENSSEWISFKKEYVNQLKLVAQKQKEGVLQVWSPLDFYHRYKNEGVTRATRILKSASFPQAGVLWYFGPEYRARIESWNGHLVLTDLRIFGQAKDPYRDEAAQASRVYWIVPYLLDSSQAFFPKDVDNQEFSGHPVRSDSGADRFGIVLTSQKLKEVKREDDMVSLIGDTDVIRLSPGMIEVETPGSPVLGKPLNLTLEKLLDLNTEQYFSFPQHPRFFIKPDNHTGKINMGWENQRLESISLVTVKRTEGRWQFIPNTGLTQGQVDSLAAIFQPDRSPLRLDPAATVFFWHNTEAIAGKSPVRLYIDPRNILGRPARVGNFTATTTGTDKIGLHLPTLENKMDAFLIDFTASESAQGQTQLSIDGNIIPGATQLRFFTDCTRTITRCVTDKEEAFGFIRVTFRERKQEYERRFKEVSQEIKNQIAALVPSLNAQILKKLSK